MHQSGAAQTNPITISIHANNSGVPGALLGNSSPRLASVLGATNEETDFEFTTPVTLNSGTSYLILVNYTQNVGGNAVINYSSASYAGERLRNDDGTFLSANRQFWFKTWELTPPGTINISTTYPVDGSAFATSGIVQFNASANLSYSTNCSLYFNNTYNQTREFSNGTDIFISFNSTILEGDSTYYFSCVNNESVVNTTATSLFYGFKLDNCSKFNTVAINFSLFNETNNSAVIGNAGGYLKIWEGDEDNFVAFNLTWNDKKNFAVCIDSNTTYNTYAQFEYTAPGFEKETYYLYNTTLSNNTKYINLFLTDNTERITFTVTDTNDNYIQDVYIHVLQYDLTTNTYQTTEILKSDSSGQAIGNIILNTEWYQFLLNYQGEIVLETAPTKITSVNKQFRINLDEDYFERYDIAHGISTSLSFTNATKNFALTWSDPSGEMHNMCLEVIKRTINGDILVNQTCVESTSGTTLINIGAPIDETYIATAWIAFDQKFIMDVLTVSYDYTWKKFGTSGVFVSFLLILAVTMVGLWNPIAAILMMVVGFIITNLIGLFHLDWEWLIALIILGGIVMYRLGRKE